MKTIIGWSIAILAWVLGASLPILGMLIASGVVLAQHNHHRGHNDYQGWSSGKTANCCNNQDCGAIDDADVRQSPDGTQIRILGEWCPVLQQHWIIRGRSPDWSSYHACISNGPWPSDRPTCDRLLCFAAKGGV